MTHALTVPDRGGEVITVEPTDAKAWELVHSVLTWMGEQSCYNYSEVFRPLDVAPASYYRAIKRPYVQSRILARLDALDKAMAKVLETHWPLVVMQTWCGLLRGMAAKPSRPLGFWPSKRKGSRSRA
jgi:hypothetical protein